MYNISVRNLMQHNMYILHNMIDTWVYQRELEAH